MNNNITSSKKGIPTYGKQDIEQCMSNFRLLILNNIDDIPKIKANLISSGKMSHSEKEFIRAFSWKVFLNTIPIDEKSTLKTWIEDTLSKRKTIKNLIKKNTLNKFKGDPLAGFSAEGQKESDDWDSFFKQSEISNIIKNDVDRTMPYEKLFQEPFIREMESTILKLFAKNYKEVSYKQGMNEILSVLIYAMYPYYVKSPITKYTNEIIDKWVKDPISNYKEIYHFFHDENELENDVYCLMENLMIKYGLSKFFDDPPRESKLTPYLIKRAKTIIIKKLGKQDRQLYNHFITQYLDFGCVFQRWLKCMLKRDNNEMFELLLHYPDPNPFNNILIMAEKIKDNLSTSNPLESEEKNTFSTSSKEQPIVKKEQIKIEEGSQSTKNMIQINPLLFNPHLMMNPQMNVNPNMMYYPYNAMMAQQQPITQPKPAPKLDFEILSKNDLSPIEKIKSSYYVSDSSSVNALKELKAIGNKYKYLFTIDDKNRLDFLIDSLSKKL